MKTLKHSIKLAAILLLALVTFAGCESTDSGSTHFTSNVYYGVGFYDPWYYGDYDNHNHDVIVTPPPSGSPPGQGLHPSQPIARPPDVSSRPPTASQQPVARPSPSIPSTPRPSPRAGGSRGGGGGGGRR